MRGVSRESLTASLARLETRLGSARANPMRMGDDLFAVTGVLAGSAGLRRAFSAPSSSPESKAGVVRALFGGKISAPARDLLAEVVAQRWAGGADLVDAVEHLAVTAFLVAAQKADRLDALEEDLFRFERAVAASTELRDAFSLRTSGAERKERLVRDLLESKVGPETLRLAIQAAVAPRGLRTGVALESYIRAAAARRAQAVARVTSARPLTEDQRERLLTGLRRVYGSAIQLEPDVDPRVLGGLRVQVGDDVLDGTVSRRLLDVRRRLSE